MKNPSEVTGCNDDVFVLLDRPPQGAPRRSIRVDVRVTVMGTCMYMIRRKNIVVHCTCDALGFLPTYSTVGTYSV